MNRQPLRQVVTQTESRRRLLRLLATSPLLALPGLSLTDALAGFAPSEDLITAPEQALNVMEFEAVARKQVPPAHFGYLATGVDDELTLRANRAGFEQYQLRMRRLRDVAKLDTSVRLFGATWDTPIVLAPVGSQKAFHPVGEVAVAKAARAKGHLQILSTETSSPVEAVNEARGTPVWFQLYPTDDWNVTRAVVKRAEAAGCPVLVLTLDLQGGSNRETSLRSRRVDTRQCLDCHVGGLGYNARLSRRPLFAGLDIAKVSGSYHGDQGTRGKANTDRLSRLAPCSQCAPWLVLPYTQLKSDLIMLCFDLDAVIPKQNKGTNRCKTESQNCSRSHCWR